MSLGYTTPGAYRNFSNTISRDAIDAVMSKSYNSVSDFADAWLSVLRRDPFYLQGNDGIRIAANQFFNNWVDVNTQLYSNFIPGYGGVEPHYEADLNQIITIKNVISIYESKYTAAEATMMGIQRQITERDHAGDFGLIKMHDLVVTAQVVQAVGIAYLGGEVIAAAGAGAAGAGAATESGTLAGSTGLLSDASITVSAFDVGGAATTVGASGASGTSALAGLGSLLPSGYSAAEIASAATAISAAASQAKNIGTQLGLIKPNAGDASIAPTNATVANTNTKPSSFPLFAALGLIFIL